MSRQPSRTISSLRRDADNDANQLITTMRQQGIDIVSLTTIRWDRRRLLNTCLLLAQRNIERAQRQPAPSPLLGRTPSSARRQAEDDRWTDTQALDAHHRYNQGLSDPETMEGNRVYKRRMRRDLVLRRMAERDLLR